MRKELIYDTSSDPQNLTINVNNSTKDYDDIMQIEEDLSMIQQCTLRLNTKSELQQIWSILKSKFGQMIGLKSFQLIIDPIFVDNSQFQDCQEICDSEREGLYTSVFSQITETIEKLEIEMTTANQIIKQGNLDRFYEKILLRFLHLKSVSLKITNSLVQTEKDLIKQRGIPFSHQNLSLLKKLTLQIDGSLDGQFTNQLGTSLKQMPCIIELYLCIPYLPKDVYENENFADSLGTLCKLEKLSIEIKEQKEQMFENFLERALQNKSHLRTLELDLGNVNNFNGELKGTDIIKNAINNAQDLEILSLKIIDDKIHQKDYQEIINEIQFHKSINYVNIKVFESNNILFLTLVRTKNITVIIPEECLKYKDEDSITFNPSQFDINYLSNINNYLNVFKDIQNVELILPDLIISEKEKNKQLSALFSNLSNLPLVKLHLDIAIPLNTISYIQSVISQKYISQNLVDLKIYLRQKQTWIEEDLDNLFTNIARLQSLKNLKIHFNGYLHSFKCLKVINFIPTLTQLSLEEQEITFTHPLKSLKYEINQNLDETGFKNLASTFSQLQLDTLSLEIHDSVDIIHLKNLISNIKECSQLKELKTFCNNQNILQLINLVNETKFLSLNFVEVLQYEILEYYPLKINLSLKLSKDINNIGLEALCIGLQNMPAIQQLSLNLQSPNLTSQSTFYLGEVFRKQTGITWLSLTFSTSEENHDELISGISNNLKQLIKINIETKGITGFSFMCLIKECLNLRQFNLNQQEYHFTKKSDHNQFVNAFSVISLEFKLPNMSSHKLKLFCNKLEESFPGLEELKLTADNLGDEDCELILCNSLRQLRFLQKIDLKQTQSRFVTLVFYELYFELPYLIKDHLIIQGQQLEIQYERNQRSLNINIQNENISQNQIQSLSNLIAHFQTISHLTITIHSFAIDIIRSLTKACKQLQNLLNLNIDIQYQTKIEDIEFENLFLEISKHNTLKDLKLSIQTRILTVSVISRFSQALSKLKCIDHALISLNTPQQHIISEIFASQANQDLEDQMTNLTEQPFKRYSMNTEVKYLTNNNSSNTLMIKPRNDDVEEGQIFKGLNLDTINFTLSSPKQPYFGNGRLFSQAFSNLKYLKHLNLQLLENCIGQQGYDQLMENFCELKCIQTLKLKIQKNSKISQIHLKSLTQTILRSANELKELDLEIANIIEQQDYYHLLQIMTEVQCLWKLSISINLKSSEYLSEEVFDFQNLKTLQQLKIAIYGDYLNIGILLQSIIAINNNLTDLSIVLGESSKVTQKDIEYLNQTFSHLKHLQHLLLKIEQLHEINIIELKGLDQLRNLQTLELDIYPENIECQQLDSLLKDIKKLPKLGRFNNMINHSYSIVFLQLTKKLEYQQPQKLSNQIHYWIDDERNITQLKLVLTETNSQQDSLNVLKGLVKQTKALKNIRSFLINIPSNIRINKQIGSLLSKIFLKSQHVQEIKLQFKELDKDGATKIILGLSHLNNLQILSFTLIDVHSDQGYLKLFTNLDKLRRLNSFSLDIQFISEEEVQHLYQSLPQIINLQNLELNIHSFGPFRRQMCLGEMISRLLNLNSISIQIDTRIKIPCPDNIIAGVQSLTKLKKININIPGIQDGVKNVREQFIQKISQFKDLKSFTFQNKILFTNEQESLLLFERLKKLPHLNSIFYQFSNIKSLKFKSQRLVTVNGKLKSS